MGLKKAHTKKTKDNIKKIKLKKGEVKGKKHRVWGIGQGKNKVSEESV